MRTKLVGVVAISVSRQPGSVPPPQGNPSGGGPDAEAQFGAAAGTEVTEHLMTDFAKSQNIEVATAKRAFADTMAIYDFVMKYQEDPAYGAIWVEYHPSYTVHFRATAKPSEAMEVDLASVKRDTGSEIERVSGGASARRLREILEVVVRTNGQMSARSDSRTGVVAPSGRVRNLCLRCWRTPSDSGRSGSTPMRFATIRLELISDQPLLQHDVPAGSLELAGLLHESVGASSPNCWRILSQSA